MWKFLVIYAAAVTLILLFASCVKDMGFLFVTLASAVAANVTGLSIGYAIQKTGRRPILFAVLAVGGCLCGYVAAVIADALVRHGYWSLHP